MGQIYIRAILFWGLYAAVALGVLNATTADSSRYTVGLVLSGGGAKGVAHIGLIQALEENDIPIDYIAGTSIGAVVGSFYAIGMSPEEMLDLVKSEDFKMWQSGKIRDEWTDYYKDWTVRPKVVGMKFILNDSLSIRRRLLPRPSLIDPSAMKFGMFETYALHSMLCSQSFDSLFVPFRAIASDICSNRPVVFSHGDLGDAVRASMSFPFVFQPTEIDGRLFYDGGIYNNFPTDVMQEDFRPDFIIGSVVSENPKCPGREDLIGQLESMVMQYTDYGLTDTVGVKIRMKMPTVSLLDFHKADELYALGYETGLKYADSLRSRIRNSVSRQAINQARRQYIVKLNALHINRIEIEGVTKVQERYVRRHFRGLDFASIRAGFYSLAADEKIDDISLRLINNRCNVGATASDSLAETPDLTLLISIRMNRDIGVKVGGLITSLNGSRFYVGGSYKSIQRVATDIHSNVQLGRLYSGLSCGLRTEIPTDFPLYCMMKLCYVAQRYSENEMRLLPGTHVDKIRQEQTYALCNFGFPLGKRGKLDMGVGYGYLKDSYVNGVRISPHYDLFRLGCELHFNQMKERFYPDSGYRFGVGGWYYKGNSYDWLRIEVEWHKYWNLSSFFSLGHSVEATWSDLPRFSSAFATQLRLPAFTPYGYTMQVFNEHLRARRYCAVGVQPVLKLFANGRLRFDSYWMQPIQIMPGDSFHWSDYFVSEVSLVFKTPWADFVGFFNLDKADDWVWNYGFRMGFLMNEPLF